MRLVIGGVEYTREGSDWYRTVDAIIGGTIRARISPALEPAWDRGGIHGLTRKQILADVAVLLDAIEERDQRIATLERGGSA